MIPENYKLPEREVKVYEPLPPNTYQCELQDIELKDGTSWEGNPERQYSFTFVVIEDGEHYGRKLWMNSNEKFVSGSKPSNLYKVITGLTGEKYEKDKCNQAHEWLNASFLNSLIGTQKVLAVSQKEKTTGGFKNVIDSILPVKQELDAYDPDKQAEDPFAD